MLSRPALGALVAAFLLACGSSSTSGGTSAGGASATSSTDASSSGSSSQSSSSAGGAASSSSSSSSSSGAFPPWRQGLTPWAWKELPSTSLGAVVPNPDLGSGLGARLDAWNGLAADAHSVYVAASGGHADYSGNEVYQFDLGADAPAWVILRQPTPAAQITLNTPYYTDGRPTSSHNYYNLQTIAKLHRVFRVGVGSSWGDGNHSFGTTDAFDLTLGDWDPKGTYGDAHGGEYARAACKDPSNEDLYATSNTHLRRFSATTLAWTDVAAWPDNGSAVYYTPCAVDNVKGRVVFFGDAYQPNAGGLAFDIKAGTFSKIVFTGAVATIGGHENMAYYDATLGAFLLKDAHAGDVYTIDPATLVVAPLAVGAGSQPPDAVNGVFTKLVYVADLRGYAYEPSTAANVWFLPAE